ncbi:MAG TPA: hypothetical protein VIG75_13945, partial [Citricoccus sp.]
AHAAGAFLALYRASGGRRWKDRARAVVEAVVRTLVVQTDHGPALLAAPPGDAVLAAAQGGPAFASPLDGAEPSAIGTWAEVLLDWHVLAPAHGRTLPGGGARAWAERLIDHVHRLGRQAPLETATTLRLAARSPRADELLVVSGGTATERRRALAWALVRGVVALQTPTGPDAAGPETSGNGDAVPAGEHPGDGMGRDDVTAGRHSRDGSLALYLCRGSMCHAPVGHTGDLDRLTGPAGGLGGRPDSGPNGP